MIPVYAAGDFKKSREYASRALKIALENNYLETAVWAYYRVGSSLPFEEYERYLDNFERGLALAKKIGDINGQLMHLDALSSIYADMGELDRAIALGEEAIALTRRSSNVQRLVISMMALRSAYRRAGDWDKSEQYSREISSLPLKEYNLITGNKNYSGVIHLDKEEYAEARESFEEVLKRIEKAGDKAGYFWNSTMLIWTLIELGEIGKATSLLDKLRWFYQETEEKWFLVCEMVFRSMLLRSQKKYEESIELFEKTLEEWELTKANVWAAYWFVRLVLCEYARAYLERGREGDKEKALNLLNRALEMFQKMGAKKDIEKVEARIAFIETGKEVSKPRYIELVSSGNADLDRLLCGGFASSSSIVLTSPSCSERNMLVKDFLDVGTKKGEVTFFVTIDPDMAKPLAEEFRTSFYLFVCNPEASAIVEDASNVAKFKGVENLTEISMALTSTIRKLDSSEKRLRRICLDLISDVLLQHHALETRRWLTALLTKLKAEDFTTLAVIDPRMHSPEELYAILGLFDGEINIRERETEKGTGRFLKIKKMSNQKYLEDELPLKKEQQ
jgi:tetratricopeptide (TPR) repeat protein/KaiC/GvpD/RAD55 family RecA-like ATPase